MHVKRSSTSLITNFLEFVILIFKNEIIKKQGYLKGSWIFVLEES